MFKLIVVCLALSITYSSAQTTSGGGSCSDDNSFVGTQPQNKGKKCSEQSPDNCKFIDESIQKCCGTCQNRQNETPGPATAGPNKPGKGGKKKGCFHGADKVETKEYGTISMSELAEKRDANVLTRNDDGQLEYSPVRYWLHAQPEISMKFQILRTQSGHRLALTGDHLIYETDCRGNGGAAIYASKVRVGRCIYVKNEQGGVQESQVIEKSQEKLNGIYAPITTTGSIVVNDVLASCYNNYENEPLQKLVYGLMIQFQDALKDWMPASLYQAAFNDQNQGGFVGVPRLVFNFLQLSNVFVH
jgi:hypothetical protein